MSDNRPVRYFDHAATSWPKPPEVLAAVQHAMTEAGGNPGRGAHPLALAAARTIAAARTSLATLLGVADERNLIFTPGCTQALNLVLKGTLKRGDRVVVSSVEHNAVVRPLSLLVGSNINIVRAPVDAAGHVDVDELEALVAAAPTRMVVCQHASNVTGTIQAIGDMADIAHDHGAVMVVDGAQGAGHLNVDVAALGVDAYACSGHKALLGPQGIGALYLAPGFEPKELVQGGSGGRSEESRQPSVRPDRYEAGTSNTPGIAGLGAGAAFLLQHGEEVRSTERALARALHDGLAAIPGITVLGPPAGEPRVPVVSILHDRVPPDQLAFALDRRFGIAVRAGLHCSPWTHAALGTLETGAVRFGIGWGLTEEDVAAAVEAVAEVCR